MSADKTLGIMAYIDNTPNMIQEFGWLYKSWIHSGNWRTSDLIIVHHPDAAAQLPHDEPGVILIPFMPVAGPGSVFEGYPFINSIACLSGPHVEPIARRYSHLLRTDADVFLTEHLTDFRPVSAVHGRGLYHRTAAFRDGMLDFCRRHGVEHMNHFGCGHSLLAPTDLVLHMVARQTYWTEVVLKDFGDNPGVWPGWFRGVATMYAAEIVCNENWIQFLYTGRERILDYESFSDCDIDGMVYHIHAIHTDDYFSKFRYRSGDYQHIDIAGLNRRRVGDYCHWVAAVDLDWIKAEAGYPGP
jgi:hypothetical protein